jgi:hypothetical protein
MDGSPPENILQDLDLFLARKAPALTGLPALLVGGLLGRLLAGDAHRVSCLLSLSSNLKQG